MDFAVIEYNGELFIATKWNGEYYGECYKRAPWCGENDTFPAEGWENKTIALKPIIQEVAEGFRPLPGILIFNGRRDGCKAAY